jgi:AhpD family alkylhydroperoxidase
MKFNKRTYGSFKEFAGDLWFPFKNRKRLKQLSDDSLLSPPFRERLMLAVTGVNGCRYCSYFHAKQALKSGIEQDELRQLLDGDIANCPEEERVALLYAQHWAEANAHPDPEAVSKLQETYGKEKTDAIHTALRMIRTGNLMGNTWDYFLYRLSCGKLGL